MPSLVYLIRHSHVDYGPGVAITADNPLTTLGHQMAQKLAERCATLELDHLFASTMPRARQTADAVARRVPDIPRTDLDDLIEVNIGDLEDYPGDKPDADLRTWQHEHYRHADRNTWKRVARAWAGIEDSVVQRGLSSIAVVSHAAAINALLRQFLELPPAQPGSAWFYLDWTSISCLRLDEKGGGVAFVNDARHIDDLRHLAPDL